MGQGKQAKLLTGAQISTLKQYLKTTRHPARNQVMLLLSLKAGLRAKEIACLTWGMVTDAEGRIGDVLALQDRASKGRSGRTIPLHQELYAALVALQRQRRRLAYPEWPVVYSERGRGMSANAVAHWFLRLYRELGFSGCSSHSGRRTFITRAARKVGQAGTSLRDVQQLAGHASLSETQKYIEGDTQGKRRLIALI